MDKFDKLKEKFDTQEKCRKFEKDFLKSDIFFLERANSHINIRDSVKDDKIGDDECGASIGLCKDFDRKVSRYKYKFVVSFYMDGCSYNSNVFDTIEEAIYDYNKACAVTKKLVQQNNVSIIDFIEENSVSEGYLSDWYISSVDDRNNPVWTDAHIAEMYGDFYLVPKEVVEKLH